MYYNVNITKIEKKLLKELNVEPETAFINGLGFIDNTYEVCLISEKRLPTKITDYIANKYVKNYGRTEENYICGKWCYMCYAKKKRKEKKNEK